MEFQIGEVIVRSWSIYSRHLLTFIVLVGIANLLPLLLTFYLGRMDPGVMSLAQARLMNGFLTFGIGVLQFILNSFAQAIVVFAAFQDLRGRPVDGAESFRQGVARIFPVVISSVLVGLLIGFGVVLCLVPGLIAMAAMSVVLPACVVERLGPIASMSRSNDLTTGHRWPIIAVAAAWAVIVFVVSLSLQGALPLGLPQQLVSWSWQVLSGSYTAVYAAILYHDLRAVREGIGIDEIAAVFD